MNLLVTGGAGYTGSVVAAQLVDAGHEVVVFDDLSTRSERAVPEGARSVRSDLLDVETLNSAPSEGFDGVLHLAALSPVGESVEHPGPYYRTNVCGTLNLLDAMRAVRVSRLIFSSTAAVYGQPEKVPVEESAPTRLTNPYGSSKLAADGIIGYEAAAGGLAAVSLRYFNVAGSSTAGQSGGVHDPNLAQMIPKVLRVAVGREEWVKVFGTDYPTSDGTAIQDFIDVEDVARPPARARSRRGGNPQSLQPWKWIRLLGERGSRGRAPDHRSPSRSSRGSSPRRRSGRRRCRQREDKGQARMEPREA